MAFQYYNVYPILTPVRLSATGNVAGVYFNGPSNNGLGATLTIGAATLTLDSQLVVNSDRVLLSAQTAPLQNGIYVVSGVGVNVVLTRAPDQQSVEQLFAGQSVSISFGDSLAGTVYVLAEPLPAHLGIDGMLFYTTTTGSVVGVITTGDFSVFADTSGNLEDLGYLPSDATKTRVVMADAAVTIGHVAVFSDVNGTIEDGGAPTSGAVLLAPSGDQHITTDSLFVDGGNLTAGSDGNQGHFISFPPSPASGTLQLQAADNAGNFNVVITNSPFAQNTQFSLQDTGSAGTYFIVGNSAIGDQHIGSGGLQVDAGALSAGSAAGGVAGSLHLYPAVAANGSLVLSPVGNVGNFAATLSNVVGLGQATVYTLPDPGAATANVLLSASSGTQSITSGNLSVASGNFDAAGTITSNGSIQSNGGFVASGYPSGISGALVVYPGVATTGTMQMLATANGGNFNNALTNDSTGQATTWHLPDPLGANGQVVVAPAALVSGNLVQASGTVGLVSNAGFAATNVVRKDSTNAMAAGSSIVLAKVNGTEVANAVTASGVAGFLTTSALTTAGGASYTITWTNTFITATSSVQLTYAGGTNAATQSFNVKCVPGAGSASLVIYNTDVLTALNGTLIFSYAVL